MTAVMVAAECDTLPDGWVWADRRELEQKYAVPNAFRSFETAVAQRLGYF